MTAFRRGRPTNVQTADLIVQADAAAAAGDLDKAHRILRELTDAGDQDPALWMKYAAISRAVGKPRIALAAVYRALEHNPLDFTALLMRASLLSAMNDPVAGEAWGEAIAQRPTGTLPTPVQEAMDSGFKIYEGWRDAREGRMAAAMAPAEASASLDERNRIERFRTNVLRRTKVFHSQPTHFHFPGLVEREFHARDRFAWLAELEAMTGDISAEFERVLIAERAELVPYIQYAAHEPLDQWRPLNHNKDWTAIHLLKNGERVDANADHCPKTMAVLERVGQPRVPGASPNAMFSLLAPNTSIPPHVGVANTRLVCHLPLIVPDGCWFRVGAETRHWRPGEAFVFDDTIEHEARNPSDELRVVFIFDIWHPDLSMTEREAVTAMLESESAKFVAL